MKYSLALFLLSLPLPGAATDPAIGNRDPLFDRYQVQRWGNGGHQTHIRWRVEISQPELSTHQRLLVRVVAIIDGRELERRRGSGEFVTLLQYRDQTGHVWQNHTSLDLEKIKTGVKSSEIIISNYAFVMPGDYDVTVAAIDSNNNDHNLLSRKLHVAPLKTEPLAGAWEGLPAVEFIPGSELPDVWYLPEIQSRLNLTLNTQRPVNLHLVVNTTPSDRASGSLAGLRRNMALLMPVVKILSQLEVRNGTMDVSLLDLTRQRVPFEQKDLRSLEWDRARKYFLETNPGIIDVRALSGQWKMRQFFLDQVVRRMAHSDEDPATAPIPVVIVLSGPAFLEDQETIQPEPPADASAYRLFYVRYRSNPMRVQRVRVRPGMRPPPPPRAFFPMPVDDLEHAVEPLGARIFDATSADQLRRVLAAILEQISRL